MGRYRCGQRWISEAEPELGVGVVEEADAFRVTLSFGASGEKRTYATESAPLRRVRLAPGAEMTTREGGRFTVSRVEDREGLLVYRTAEGGEFSETELGDGQSCGTPDEELMRGRAGHWRDFKLRKMALELQHRRRRSEVRGFVGGRIDLILHQLYIASEVTSRVAPRVLLADEVGLGKTIEACLIVHRLLGTGRVSRVLIVVPEPLVHQWFVELLRRFNLWFHIFDEARCAAIEATNPEVNPFLDDQWILCGLPLLLQGRRAEQAMEAGWDLLVVDEAHHLEWAPDSPSPAYRVIEDLGKRTEGLLLLTATPEQLGMAGHFARLRLLDPDRYFDLGEFEKESAGYQRVAALAKRLESKESLSAADQETLRAVFRQEPDFVQDRLDAVQSGETTARQEVLKAMLDRHGTGRVMFRNRRAAMKGFPVRVPRPVPLEIDPEDEASMRRLADEFASDTASRGDGAVVGPDLSRDARVIWLVEFLRRRRKDKVLLICRTREKVLALDAALRTHVNVPLAMFHEGLELVQRDRQAAWFAEADGAQVLLASEIGSEGRNFQFAHHLVLFDLPLDPELLEQRIGRLDRIGQVKDVEIHVPYVVNSPQEVVFRWFHEGLDAFSRHLHGGRALMDEFRGEVLDFAQDFHETHDGRRTELGHLLARTRRSREDLSLRLEQGRDRLLELNSFRAEPAQRIATAIRALDADEQLEQFLLQIWDHYGVPVEDRAARSYRVGGDGVYTDRFPGLPPEGMLATFDRRAALGREEVGFLTWDHPMVTGALDLFLGSPEGRTACGIWPEAPARGLWLEVIYLLECMAPARLHTDRFLASTPILSVVDARGKAVSDQNLRALDQANLKDLPIHDLLARSEIRELVTRQMRAARERAESLAKPILAEACRAVGDQMGAEIERLRALAEVNPNVRVAEIRAMETQRALLLEHVQAARLRVDAVRLLLLGREMPEF